MNHPVRRQWRRLLAPAILTIILLLAALLRLDALFESFGPYQQPPWLAAVEPAVEVTAPLVSPRDWHWPHVEHPYAGGDPQNYLRFAREMRHFYQAHVREPMFLAATRLSLALTHDEDVAISLTSIAFSLLTLVATYMVGRQMASPAVGLAAAAALGLDHTAVGWSIGGWRDEMFAFFVVLDAWAVLRMSRSGTYGDAGLAGVIGAATCLTRLTALTLLAPAWVWLALTGGAAKRRRRLQQLAVATVVGGALVAPYLINCAIETGDPLYAINYHTRFYLAREGVQGPPSGSALDYTLYQFGAHPLASADTAAQGIVVHPFMNKWTGLDKWYPGLGRVLSWLAIGGLAGWLWQPSGRLLLLMLAGSLVPYMLTWPIAGGGEWRFTLHAYPFYLLAAFWMLERVVRTTLAVKRTGVAESLRRVLQAGHRGRLLVLTALALGGAVWAYGMPWLIARESLLDGRPTTIVAGRRDRWFFSRGWSDLVVLGNVTARFATEPVSTLAIPLPEKSSYTLVLRMDPLDYPAAVPQTVRVFVNRKLLAVLHLGWDSARVGEYQVPLPRGLARQGLNEIALMPRVMVPVGRAGAAFPAVPRDRVVGFRLWYLQIIPGASP